MAADLASTEFDRLVSLIPDPTWVRRFHRVLRTTQDVLLYSEEPQNGKTQVIILIMWYSKYIKDKTPILVIDNSTVDLLQFMARVRLFNQTTDYPLDVFDLKTSISQLQANRYMDIRQPLITTTQVQRYSLLELFSDCVIVYDEADQSVGSALLETKLIKEHIWRELRTKHNQFYYITATEFAVIQTRMFRDFKVLRITTQMYPGLEYRGYEHKSNEISTDYDVSVLKDADPDAFEHIVGLIQSFVDDRVTPTQPNIMLINVVFKNQDKIRIVQGLRKLGFDLDYIIYTGEGLSHYFPGVDEPIVRKKSYIGEYLEVLKSEGVDRPLIIISTRKATRSQTYKSTGNEWKLTHFILHIPRTATAETIIQSLRFCGQYDPMSVGVRIYLTKESQQHIEYALWNKRAITRRIKQGMRESRGIPPEEIAGRIRDTLLSIRVRKVPSYPLALSRPEIFTYGIRTFHNNICEFDTIEDATDFFKDKGDVRLVTIFYEPKVKRLFRRYPEIEDACVRNVTAGLSPYVNLDEMDQEHIRDFVKRYLSRKGYDMNGVTCQIGYSEERSARLNRPLGDRGRPNPPGFRVDNSWSEVVALHWNNRDTIPIVYYTGNYADTTLMAWHTTAGKIHVYAGALEYNVCELVPKPLQLYLE